MRVVVVGAGGLGGLFGGLLARQGEEVVFVARGAGLKALREQGLTVRSPVFGNFTVPTRATDDVGQIEPPDLVLFCVKTYDLEPAAEQIRPLVGASTAVLPFQNGIDATERLGRIVGAGAVLVGVTYARSARTAPATFDHAVHTRTIFGELAGGMSPRVEAIAKLLRDAGLAVETPTDPQVPLWEKFVGFGAYGGMTALTRLPIGPVLACPETRMMLQEAMREIVAVGRARGVAIPTECVDQLMALVQALPAEVRPSIAEDLAAGRRLELDSTNGAIVRFGRELDVPTPVNAAIYAALKPYEQGAPTLP
jgi:2-dehydropantoate 2-reductase